MKSPLKAAVLVVGLIGCGSDKGTKTTETKTTATLPPKVETSTAAPSRSEASGNPGHASSGDGDKAKTLIKSKGGSVWDINGKNDGAPCGATLPSFTDAEFETLVTLAPDLQFVELPSEVTDRSVASLLRLRELRHIKGALSFTTAGYRELAKSPNLECVELVYAKPNDDDLKAIVAIPKLLKLTVWGCDVTDAGVKTISENKRLSRLILHGCPVSDAALGDLGSVKSLTFIDLVGTKVTDSGVAKLKKSLPSAEIVGPK